MGVNFRLEFITITLGTKVKTEHVCYIRMILHGGIFRHCLTLPENYVNSVVLWLSVIC